MISTIPLIIEDKNLSYAWSRALLQIISNPGKKISPLVISLTDFNGNKPNEDINIRNALDKLLKTHGHQKIETVANTIFPYSLWRRSCYDRTNLFNRYINLIPRIKSIEKTKNKRGLYFERLISFEDGSNNINQLEHIISKYNSRSGVRTSMFQASIFDPRRDHINDAQMGFPCLQHISFVPDNNSLTLNAFYATQQLFHKAYGNYLGLCQLGLFMAREMNLNLERMNCFIGVEKLEKISKTSKDLKELTTIYIDSCTNSNSI